MEVTRNLYFISAGPDQNLCGNLTTLQGSDPGKARGVEEGAFYPGREEPEVVGRARARPVRTGASPTRTRTAGALGLDDLSKYLD